LSTCDELLNTHLLTYLLTSVYFCWAGRSRWQQVSTSCRWLFQWQNHEEGFLWAAVEPRRRV